MARGNECKTVSNTSYAVKQMEFPSAYKNAAGSSKISQAPKVQEKKNYGAWGPVFKDKKHFVDMHFC